jgi:hypothetical protein
MKNVMIVAFICAASLGAAQAAPAPADLEKMRAAFAAAIAGKHVDAAMKMMHFPLIQEVYQEPPKVTAAQFGKDLGNLALDDAAIQHCVAHDPLEMTVTKDASNKGFIGAWNVNCDGNIYYFARKSGAWLFIGYENINE